MRMRRKSKSKRVILLPLLISLIVFLSTEALIRPNLVVIAKHRCAWLAVEAVNAAILSELDSGEELIENAVKINRASDGKITSVVSSGYFFGIIKEHISKKLISEFSDTRHIKTTVSLGSLFGIPTLSTKPEIPIYIYAVGTPETEIDGTLVTTGINQSIYRIVLTYSVEITSVIAFHPISSVVTDEIVLSEIVFSGEVPKVVINK